MTHPYIVVIGRLKGEDNGMAVFQNSTAKTARKAYHKQLRDIYEDRSGSRDLIIDAIIASNEPPQVLESDTMNKVRTPGV